MNKLKPLPKDVFFVSYELDLWPELNHKREYSLDDLDPEKLKTIDSCWIIQTFLQLKIRGLNVHLVKELIPGEICIVSSGDFFASDNYNEKSFLVSVRGDCARDVYADISIVQNRFTVKRKTDVFINHWPQPKIIHRDETRKNKVEIVGFKGDDYDKFICNDSFINKMNEHNIQLIIHGLNDSNRWNDYSDFDVIVAIRSHYAVQKPASKLINAWIAGVPAILGPEPAYQELRNNEYDYIEASDENEVFDAIIELKNNHEKYSRIIENGKERSQKFTSDSTARLWRDSLAEIVYDEYKSWKKKSVLRRKIEHIIKRILQKNIWRKVKVIDILLSMLKFKNKDCISKRIAYWAYR